MGNDEKFTLWKSLRRIEGQVGGIGKMVNEGADCGAILTQISAAMSALKSVGRELLTQEMEKCAKTASGREKYAKLLKRFF